MTYRVQFIGKTTAEIASFTPLIREMVVEETKKTLVVGDGTTAGGIPMAREDLDNVAAADVASALSGGTIASVTVTALTSTRITYGQGAEITLQEATEPAAVSGAQGPVAFKDRLTLWYHINGNASVSFSAETSGTIGDGMRVAITQGTGGGHTFTFTGCTLVGSQTDMTTLAEDDVAHFSVWPGADGTLFYAEYAIVEA